MRKNGYVLLEIVIATAVVTATLMASVSVAAKALEASRLAVREAQATALLQEGAEAVKILRGGDWEAVASAEVDTPYYLAWGENGWALSLDPQLTDGFVRTVQFSAVYRDASDDIADTGSLDSGTRKVTVSLTWTDKGAAFTRSVLLYVSDIYSS